MFGIVHINGHQYKVSPGQILDVEKMKNSNEGTNVDLPSVLMVVGDQSMVGAPYVSGAKVVAKIVRHDRSRKMIIFKRRPGKYYKKNGHRQQFTTLLITEIHDGKGGIAKIENDNKNAKKYLK
jgi:large subunit ribosomal protein L21